jgi:hypothetical protein
MWIVGYAAKGEAFDWSVAMGAGTAAGTILLAAATYWLVRGTQRAATAAGEELHETKAATQLAAYIDLLREYRSQPMRMARTRIHRLGECDRSRGLTQLGRRDREGVEMISHYLDNVGLLVSEELLGPEPAAAFLGGSAEGMWRKLGPYIYAERRERGPTYQRHFEYLAAVFSGMEYETKIERLPRLPPPDWREST